MKFNKPTFNKFRNAKFNKMKNLRQQYNDLNNETAQLFSELLKQANGKINFFEGEEISEEIEYFNNATFYECRNDIAGNCYDAYVFSVSNEGILIAESEDTDHQYTIKFSDFANLQDKISLVEEMQILLNN